ncbi:hypothetical protein L905_21600 [Agrobacterium sp. TS43]|nr:hypothetical protein L902_10570 [Agrobacterium radiobacter DSM 30147]KDR87220.1 hypothetical protein K538_28530 [Agrobacterium tumefaciens GW4]KVK45083.1 hypothetical protein L904_26325 [Agrobacterium sp. LY4]KVK45171.1 hypothetical protein L903_26495 [Agrobacterium sp. JL28]KVK58527.1 hypothetical protein L906_26410 [Agrobacterium sp. TS45]KVK61301.1 hypothetical protein L905_21600 [Agrobacterium sp. TS43]KVK61828.1 hypothetical protein L907_26055 [Agrobacterium sp. C13]
MSLVCIALRICAVQAVKGRTLVGDNVLDSEIGALETSSAGELNTPEEKQFVSVYTDEGRQMTGLELRSLIASGEIDLVFEAGVATPHLVSDPETDEKVIMAGLPATDANFEFYLNMTLRQIADALADPKNEWAAIFNRLVLKFVKSQRSRISGDTNGVRLAAHQIKITVEPVAEPVAGHPLKPGTPMAAFFAKCESDLVHREPDMVKKIALMKAQIAGNDEELAAAMRRYGMTHSEADAMLLTLPDGGAP